ncbi:MULTISPECIES: GNAT family N-acetyltransferase [unclassified Cupriavidus]|uniref:GNAT family N-acetyltransferase n=1 Tax=unclassified Cupriavidus TaxID=2640874 RepID=UPI003F9285B8
MNAPIDIQHLESRPDWLAAFPVMKALRPHLRDAQAFASQLERQHAQGYRLLAARQHGEILGLAGYRLQENLIYGRFVYVDDLVVAASLQRSGLGARLLDAARQQAVARDCTHFVLDTGLHMALAQRFYFRQGLLARGMHFVEALSQGSEA